MTGLEYSSASTDKIANLRKRVSLEARNLNLDVRDVIEIEGWHRHRNADGDYGGWIEDTAYVSEDCFVGQYCCICDEASVAGCEVTGSSIVGGEAQLRKCIVGARAQVFGGILFKAEVVGSSRVFGGDIRGIFRQTYNERSVFLCDEARVYGGSIRGGVSVADNASISWGYVHTELPGQQINLRKSSKISGGEVTVGTPDGIVTISGNRVIREEECISEPGEYR